MISADAGSRVGVPGLRRGVRLVHDSVRSTFALLYPEGVLLLNESAGAILARCDGIRTATDIVGLLGQTYEGVTDSDIQHLLDDLTERRLITFDGTGTPVNTAPEIHRPGASARSPAPLGLLAELTYRCPLHCTYCANPLNLASYHAELDTDAWCRVLDQARDIGVLQVHFSGGEPLLRRDLETLVGHAHQLGMYINLITSGIPLAVDRLGALIDAGLDHFQLSVQDDRQAEADQVAGLRAHERKLAVAAKVKESGLPLSVNAVLHRGNVGRLLEIVEMAASLGADRVELAHTQFYGWALRNRAALMPTAEQVQAATLDAITARQRFGDRMEIVHIAADYHTNTPKPCMDGWGSRQLVVAPNGDALPCLAAAQLPDIQIPSTLEAPLSEIWYESPAFNRFRGTAWMPEPCQSCALREVDFGGCRCQAYQLVGDPAATDPVCTLSPHHERVAATLVPQLQPAQAVPRRMR
ncbi:pyrroloquinoline quinone biosynthesis protein PqqE [Nakamurella lactea]|uniref:pyrroloquinoline quinone biosynthesis protein PqqE n=1 Tax=Nakamurella lactea TaxID=459515 RepID=UPI0006844807|nr:pyrroloquinoline quinone biosynthesis protein PqqE [Nakamurella lactea]